MDQEQIKKLTSFFYEIGTLRKIPRSHQQTLLFQDSSDNIASHTFRAAVIGYFMAKQLEADADKVLKMCLIHDFEEARTGDQNWLHKKYIKSFEDEVRKEQFRGIENIEETKALSKEYDERKTKEAQIAKDADYLDELFLLREYEWQGSKEAALWLKGINGESEQEKRMFTNLAKEIAKELKVQDPSSWWQNSWVAKKRE